MTLRWRRGRDKVGKNISTSQDITRKCGKTEMHVCVRTKFRLLQPRTKTEGSGVRFHVLLVAGDWGRRAEHQAPRPRVAPSAPQSSADCRQPDARRAPTHVISARSCASPDVTPSGHGPRVATRKPERGWVNDHLTTVLQANSLHSYHRHAHKDPVVPTTINSPLFPAPLFARSHPVSDVVNEPML